MLRRDGAALRVIVKTLGPNIGDGDGQLPDAKYDGDRDFRVNDGRPNERAALPDEVRDMADATRDGTRVERLRSLLDSDGRAFDERARQLAREMYTTSGTDRRGRPWHSEVRAVSQLDPAEGRYRLSGQILDSATKTDIGEFTREIEIATGRVDHLSFGMDVDRAGQGVGGRFVRDSIVNARNAGFSVVNLVAFAGGKTNGVFVWPRLGFETVGPLMGDDNLEALDRLDKSITEVTARDLLDNAENLRAADGGYLDLNIDMTLDLKKVPAEREVKSALESPHTWNEWTALADTWIETPRRRSAGREAKALGSTIGRAQIGSRERFDPDAVNGDPQNDVTVQDGTPWERPATPLRALRRVADRVRATRTARRDNRRAAAVEHALSLDTVPSSSGIRRLLNQLGPRRREAEITSEDLVNHFALIRNRVEQKHGRITTASEAKAVLKKVLPNLIDSPDTMPSFTNPDGELTARERGWVHTLVHHADRHPDAAAWIVQLDYSPSNTRWKASPEARGYVGATFVTGGDRRAHGFGLVYGISGTVQTDMPEINHNIGSSAIRDMMDGNTNEDVIQEVRAMLTAQHEWGHVLHDDRILRHVGRTPDAEPMKRADEMWEHFSDREKAAAYAAKNLELELVQFNREQQRLKRPTIPQQVREALVHAKYRDMGLDEDNVKWMEALEFIEAQTEKLREESDIDVTDLLDKADMLAHNIRQLFLATGGNKESLIRQRQIGNATDPPDVARMKLYSHFLSSAIAYVFGLYSMDDLSKEESTAARQDLFELSLYAASEPLGREGIAEGFSARALGVGTGNRHVNYLFDDWMKVPPMQEEKAAKATAWEVPPSFGFPLAFEPDGTPFVLSCSPEPPTAAQAARERRARRSPTTKDTTVLRSTNKKTLGPNIGGGEKPLGDAKYDGDHDGRMNDGKRNEMPAPPKEAVDALHGVKKVVEGDGVEQIMVDPVPEFAKVLPRSREVDYHAVRAKDPAFRRELADALRDAPEGIDPQRGVREAYDAFIQEVDAQYERLLKILEGMGVKIDFTMDDPYADVAEMEHDLRVNKRFKVLMTKATGSHSLMSDEQNDRLRAVHDAFGHLGTGRGFDRHGEEAAYQAHRTMFSPLAQRVLAAEFRAQTAYLIEYKQFLEEQKATIMAARYVKKLQLWVQFKAIGGRSIGQRVTKTPARITADDDNLYRLGKSHHVSGGRHFANKK